jgi:MFS transporter, DHA1 family, multidrug resistance protein
VDPRDRTAVLALAATDFCARTSYGLCRSPLLPLWAATLGAGPAEIGTIGAAATITGLFVKFPAGALSDVLGRGPLLLAGLLVFAAGPLLYPLASGLGALLLLRFVHGLATALYGPPAMAAGAALAGERRAEVLSWLSNTKIAGSLGGAFLGGWILTGTFTRKAAHGLAPDTTAFATAWHVAAAFAGVALLLGLGVLLRSAAAGVGSGRKGGFTRLLRGLKEAASNRALVLVSATESLQSAAVGILEQFLPVYAVLVAGLSALQAGILFAVQMLAAILTRPLFGRIADRRGHGVLLGAGMWTCAGTFALLPWTSDFTLLLGLAFVFGIGEALVTSSAAALAADVAQGAGLGAAMGAFGTIGDAGHAAGPVFGGIALALAGWHGSADVVSADPFRVCFAAVAALMALSMIALRVLVPQRVLTRTE